MSGTSLTILPDRQTITVNPGDSVQDALIQAGRLVESPCDGGGRCGKCKVRVSPPDAVAPTPHDAILPDEASAGVRLACRIRPQHAALQIELLDRIQPAASAQNASPRRVATGRVGLALDLGTTTLAATLVELTSAQRIAEAHALNPQRSFGHDVISRVHRGSTPAGLAQLCHPIRRALHQLARLVCGQAGTPPDRVDRIVIGGNPAMLELAANIDPTPLGVAPYRATFRGGSKPAAAFGLESLEPAELYVPPVLDAFIGADVSAGLLAAAPLMRDGETVLFADLGTNGEIVLRHPGGWLATSAAAGPAFEGMGLSSGMSAADGAIAQVSLVDGELSYAVIGDVQPRGICGSGAIDLIATLLESHVIDPSGRIVDPTGSDRVPPGLRSRITMRNEQRAVAVAPGVWFTQHDVRQFQLAKGAIRAAIDVLMARAGIENVTRLVPTGGFGAQLDQSSAEKVGLFPRGVPRYDFLGNACLDGCERLLVDGLAKERLEALVGEIQCVNLADVPDYMERFTDRMGFEGVDHEPQNPCERTL